MICLTTLSALAKYLLMIRKNFPQKELNTNPQSISNWVYPWMMRFNPDANKQAHKVYFSRKTNKRYLQNLSFHGFDAEVCYSEKHLGLIMDNKLNFDVHVLNKISKCIKIIGIIKRLSVIIPRDVFLKLYKMFIRLHLDYADIVNDKPSNELFCKKMERVHYKACLAIIQAIQGTSQEKLGLESLSDRR